MTKKIAVVGLVTLMMLVGGFQFQARATVVDDLNITTTNNDSADVLRVKLKKSENRIKELEDKKIVQRPQVADLDDADRFVPSIDQDQKGHGPAIVVGPKLGNTTVWMTLTGATQANSIWTLEGDVRGLKIKAVSTAETKVLPEGATFAVGNRVAIYGKMVNGVITITKVRNHSDIETKTNDVSVKIQELMKKLKEICATANPKPAACANF